MTLTESIPSLDRPLLGALPLVRASAEHESLVVPRPLAPAPADMARYLVSVPVARFVELDCDKCLRELEARGVRVDRSKGASAIDAARNIRASQAVVKGEAESIMFIDSDMMFDPEDAIKLFRRPEPVVAGIYAAKLLGNGQLNAHFAPDIGGVKMGPWADRLYPARRIGGGFLRIRVDFLKRMIKALKLPYCRLGPTFAWPFFQPVVIDEEGEKRYLTEDYAFAWRCEQMGEPILADTTFRLYHLGDYPYGWEEAAGEYVQRSRNLRYEVRPSLSERPALPADLEVELA
jgi:hypothetical protein